MESKRRRENVKKTKMIISGETAGKFSVEGKFPFAFSKRVLAVIPPFASFADFGCI